MLNSSVYIRVDGNEQIGLGHLVRCFGLAKMLNSFFNIIFICRSAPAGFAKELKDHSLSYFDIDSESDFIRLIKADDIVVLDGYHFDTSYQKNLKQKGCTLVCIDDLCDKPFFADLIINHSPGFDPVEYNAQFYTQFALGLDYALLRPVFLNSLVKGKDIDPIKDSLLICFGGSDNKNLTIDVLKFVLENAEFKLINIVTGQAYRRVDELNDLISSNSDIRHYHAISEYQMVELIKTSSISIVPSSGVLLEVLAVGNTVISGMYVENQKYLFKNFRKIGAFISAEDFSPVHLKDALKESIGTSGDHPRLIDGKSGERILKLFKQLDIEKGVKIRRAEDIDLELTYRWAINKVIRAFSFNQSDIGIEEHSAWFNEKIVDKNCFYYIVEIGDKIIGGIRFDITGESALISYLLDTAFHGKGLGIVVLKKGIIQFKRDCSMHVNSIVGFVIKSNIASLKAFEKLGFSKEEEQNNCKFILEI